MRCGTRRAGRKGRRGRDGTFSNAQKGAARAKRVGMRAGETHREPPAAFSHSFPSLSALAQATTCCAPPLARRGGAEAACAHGARSTPTRRPAGGAPSIRPGGATTLACGAHRVDVASLFAVAWPAAASGRGGSAQLAFRRGMRVTERIKGQRSGGRLIWRKALTSCFLSGLSAHDSFTPPHAPQTGAHCKPRSRRAATTGPRRSRQATAMRRDCEGSCPLPRRPRGK